MSKVLRTRLNCRLLCVFFRIASLLGRGLFFFFFFRVLHTILSHLRAHAIARSITAAASFFFGVYSWLVKVLGQFSIIYFRGLGLRIGVRVWVRVRVGVRVWVRVRVRVRVRVSVVLWSG